MPRLTIMPKNTTSDKVYPPTTQNIAVSEVNGHVYETHVMRYIERSEIYRMEWDVSLFFFYSSRSERLWLLYFFCFYLFLLFFLSLVLSFFLFSFSLFLFFLSCLFFFSLWWRNLHAMVDKCPYHLPEGYEVSDYACKKNTQCFQWLQSVMHCVTLCEFPEVYWYTTNKLLADCQSNWLIITKNRLPIWQTVLRMMRFNHRKCCTIWGICMCIMLGFTAGINSKVRLWRTHSVRLCLLFRI